MRNRLREIWYAMIRRCHREGSPAFSYYGGRGIRVCDRWRASFEAFALDVGSRPSLAHTLDRIDNNGNYEPGNVRWATRSEQQANTRRTVLVDVGGKAVPFSVAARENAVLSQRQVFDRVAEGMSRQDALCAPRRPGNRAKMPIGTRHVVFGETVTRGEAVRRFSVVSQRVVYARMARGWTFEQALATPAGGNPT